MSSSQEAFARHFFHCEFCEIGDSVLEDRLCPIGMYFAHQLVLDITDEHAQSDWNEGRLSVPKVCMDCGKAITTTVELDRHDLVCHGPVTLIHTEDGIFGEVQ